MNRDKIVADVSDHLSNEVSSLILTGSMVDNSTNSHSDIDFIVITSDDSQKEKVRRISSKIQKAIPQFLIDCKIYTIDEYNRAKGGQDHFFLWTSFKKCRILHGLELSQDVKLKPQLVKDALWKYISDVENASSLLSAEVQFTGACVTLYLAAATAYFVDKFILSSGRPSTKREYLKLHLGRGFPLITERYGWIRRQVLDSTTVRQLKVSTKIDRRYSSSEYAVVRESAESVLTINQRVLRELSDIY